MHIRHRCELSTLPELPTAMLTDGNHSLSRKHSLPNQVSRQSYGSEWNAAALISMTVRHFPFRNGSARTRAVYPLRSTPCGSFAAHNARNSSRRG